MALDPESQRLIDLMAAANRPAWNTLSPQAARDLYLSLRPGAQGPRPAHVTVVDRTIPGPAGNLPVRIYRPTAAAADAKLPALVYAHGGGWVFGNLDSHDVLCAQLAIEAGIAVFHVDYRLAPEARFPGAFDDVVAALKWVAANGETVGIDPTRLAIGGDSAGGNLAAAASIWARDHGGPKLLMQLLAYPVTDAVARTESYRRYEDGYGLNAVTMEWFFDHYTPDKASRGDWRVSPLRAASLAGLPPALVVTAGYDPLRDEGRAYAWRLHQEGTQADLVEFGGMLHGFLSSPMLLHGARRGTTLCAAALREALVLRTQ
ncbi:alpha/beta hydrolase [Reyranella aquatilis]|uniref:Alpha/beta hydrolase n=1 Tax=Reyranella aquatilis TaxID=2035356 RepID=A0ABS8KUP5_9HYPH|nr:alpha/beta hydrolase [Reyranella aquatilis]MCC8429793.1 alpha/beta hydrolase [Reyranella aquatilis]